MHLIYRFNIYIYKLIYRTVRMVNNAFYIFIHRCQRVYLDSQPSPKSITSDAPGTCLQTDLPTFSHLCARSPLAADRGLQRK